ncbi:Zinc_finger domain-containing protein [Hexamita inflata]|uniref:Zinc finger domain-containing protein n=1 Tax=Hexamita inflata TaxID=28002 RepID=A0AA86QJ53_9EUKA|nr:Zinc finger domain-containing protein [Hexamita inflata]
MNVSCPICLDVPNYPVLLNCGHVFCCDCVHFWFKNIRSCPVCKQQQILPLVKVYIGRTDGEDRRDVEDIINQEVQRDVRYVYRLPRQQAKVRPYELPKRT